MWSQLLPDFVNANFIQKILRNSENDDSIEVQNISSKPATAKGDNYASDITRITVEYSQGKREHKVEKKSSLVIKVEPIEEGMRKDVIKQTGVFDTEIEMMTSTIKEMEKILDEDGCRFSANALYAEMGDPSLIVLEDLAPLGYRLADRQAGFDLPHATLAIRKLAKFHATSVALYEKKPEIRSKCSRGNFCREYPEEDKLFFVNGIISLGNELAKWTELEPWYSEKILKLSKVCYEKAVECAVVKEDEFNVINHGDFWVNNMLFRYNEEGQVIDHIFIDFQISYWGSPALDILYFLNTSLSIDVSINHRVTLIKEYLTTLTETMAKIGCKTKAPTMAALVKSMREREFFGVMAGCTVQSLVLVDKSEVIKLDQMMTQGYDNPAYRGTLFRKTMVRKLPEWNARGLLDC